MDIAEYGVRAGSTATDHGPHSRKKRHDAGSDTYGKKAAKVGLRKKLDGLRNNAS